MRGCVGLCVATITQVISFLLHILQFKESSLNRDNQEQCFYCYIQCFRMWNDSEEELPDFLSLVPKVSQ